MRVFTSLALAVVFVLVTLGVSRQASAVPEIGFATGVRMPNECEAFPVPDPAGTPGTLYCTAPLSTVLTFSVVIIVGSEGMQGYSFGAAWDQLGQNELENVSAQQAFDGTLYASKTPPLLTAGFGPAGGARSAVPGIIDSTVSSGGLLPSWSAISSAPESEDYSGARLDGASYRAGRISVTVKTGSTGTVLKLGFFDPNKDSFLAPGLTGISPIFSYANINTAPEPAAVLSALAGLAAIGYLGVRSRRSR